MGSAGWFFCSPVLAGSWCSRGWDGPSSPLTSLVLGVAIWRLSGGSAQSSLILPQGASPDGLGSSHLRGWIPGDSVPREKVEAEDLGV